MVTAELTSVTENIGSDGDGKVRVATKDLQCISVCRLLKTLVVHLQYLPSTTRTDHHRSSPITDHLIPDTVNLQPSSSYKVIEKSENNKTPEKTVCHGTHFDCHILKAI